MHVFWEKGYEGTSLTDLTEAMGIKRSSMYASFGNKQALFGAVLGRYAEGPLAWMGEVLDQPTARRVVEALLYGALAFLTDDSHPRTCISIQNLAGGVESEPIRDAMIEWRKGGEAAIRKRLERARAEGDFPQHLNPGDFARYLMTIQTGLGVQVANGASRAQIARVVRIALQSMPL